MHGLKYEVQIIYILQIFITDVPTYFFRITNLKYWGGSETIISKTLQLLSDLSVGYGTVRKLVRFFLSKMIF